MDMFHFLKLKKDDDLKIVCKHLFETFNIKYSDLHLERALEEHVDAPSLLSIKDIIFEYGVESAAIRKANYNYYDFETPFICSIQQEDWHKASFTIISQVNETNITYLESQTNKFKEIPLSQFEQIDKGIILLTDDSHKKDELNLSSNLIKQRNQTIARNVPIYLGLITLLISLGYNVFNFQTGVSWGNIIFTITSFIGIVVCSILVWYEIDAYNPIIKEVCGNEGKRINCDAVLKSPHSSLLGISWSIWGLAFMATLFSIQLFFSGNSSFLYLSSLLSFIATPYIIFSIYYQSKVVKQWCSLCLVIQVLLIVNCLTAILFTYNNRINPIPITSYSGLLTLLLALYFLVITYMLIPVLKSARDNDGSEKKWKKLHYDPNIFQTLLGKSEKIVVSVEELGIVIGNPHAKNEIVKVCNPHCNPCAKAHPELANIIKDNLDVKVRIIFATSGKEEDPLIVPVQHFLALQEKYGNETLHLALDDWYLANIKDYDIFKKKYPIKGELKQQNDKITAMKKWCVKMKIRATPTIYINGFELPESYQISDLKNFF